MIIPEQRSLWALTFAFGIALLFYGCEQQKYPWGRDTVDSFGDGRFEIVRGPDDGLGLNDREHGAVVDDVKSWESNAEYVFLVNGKHQCWKVDYRNGTVKSYKKAGDAEPEDRRVFEELMGGREEKVSGKKRCREPIPGTVPDTFGVPVGR